MIRIHRTLQQDGGIHDIQLFHRYVIPTHLSPSLSFLDNARTVNIFLTQSSFCLFVWYVRHGPGSLQKLHHPSTEQFPDKFIDKLYAIGGDNYVTNDDGSRSPKSLAEL